MYSLISVFFFFWFIVVALVLAIRFTSGRDRLLSYSLFNWRGLKGVLHKAAESTAGVCVSGVRAKFSKSSQCVSLNDSTCWRVCRETHECITSHANMLQAHRCIFTPAGEHTVLTRFYVSAHSYVGCLGMHAEQGDYRM